MLEFTGQLFKELHFKNLGKGCNVFEPFQMSSTIKSYCSIPGILLRDECINVKNIIAGQFGRYLWRFFLKGGKRNISKYRSRKVLICLNIFLSCGKFPFQENSVHLHRTCT